jgi:hypothetical protein
VRTRTILRTGAVAGIGYTALTVGVQVVGSTVPPVGTKTTLSNEQNDALFLVWISHHLDFYNLFAAAAIAGYLLLAVVAVALFTLLRRPGGRLPLVGACIGLLGMALSCLAAILQRVDYVNRAAAYQTGRGAGALLSVVKKFETLASRDYGIDMAGHLGTAFWIGLVGASLLPLLGRRSLAVWGSLGACLLSGLGLPFVVPLWSMGAGFGLWRMGDTPLGTAMLPVPSPTDPAERQWAPDAVPAHPRRRSRPAPAQAETSFAEPPADLSRPPRGTSEPRRVPAPARGSKAARARKRH